MTIPMTAKRLFGYAGRDIQPGSHFEAETERDAKLLNLLGRAEYRTAAIACAPVHKVVKPAAELPPPPAAEELQALKVEPKDDLPALRAEYNALFGKKPFMGWTADELRAKIAEHTGTKTEDAE